MLILYAHRTNYMLIMYALRANKNYALRTDEIRSIKFLDGWENRSDFEKKNLSLKIYTFSVA